MGFAVLHSRAFTFYFSLKKKRFWQSQSERKKKNKNEFKSKTSALLPHWVEERLQSAVGMKNPMYHSG